MNKFLTLLAAIVVLSFGCRRDIAESSWNTQVVTPLIKSSMSLDDLLGDTMVQKNNDNSLKVVYNQHLYSANTDSLFKFPDSTYTYGTSLQTLVLSNDSVVHSITLGQIAREQGGFIGPFILSNQGVPFPFPAMTDISSSDIAMDGGAFFESVDVLTGFLDIRINNNLPVDISLLDFLLKNDILLGGDTIASGTFPLIPSGGSQLMSFPLDGKSVKSKMLGKIIKMNTDASVGAVPIDTNNAVTAIIKIRDLKPQSATAYFPGQEVFKKIEGIKLSALSKMMLNEIKVKSGEVHVEVFSSIRDTIFFHYEIPSASSGGIPFQVDTFVPPALPNSTTSFSYTYPFKDYTLNLRGFGIEDDLGEDINGNGFYDPDTVNTFVQKLLGSIKAKNQMVTLTIGDTFYVNAGLRALVPAYGEGYIGNDTMQIGPSSTSLSVFNKMVSGSVNFEDVKVDLEVTNGLGAKLDVDVDNITAVNTKQNNSLALSNVTISSPISIDKALKVPQGQLPVTPQKVVISLDKGNSNIDQFVEVFPDRIDYKMAVRLNSDIVTPPTYTDVLTSPPNFAYNSTGVDVSMNIEIPLSMIAQDLVLADTIDFSITKSDATQGYQNGTFTLLTNNGFPFSTEVSIYMLDANNNVVDSIFSHGNIPAANIYLDGAEWKVSSKKSSEITFPVDVTKMEKLFNASKLLVIAKFNTAQPGSDYIKVYTDYSIDFKLAGDFGYQVRVKN